MAKVWTATSGPDEQQCFLSTLGQGMIGMSAEEVGTIAGGDGDYTGQPLHWDGDDWSKLPLGQPLVFSLIRIEGEFQAQGLDVSSNGSFLILAPTVAALDNNFNGEARVSVTGGGNFFAYPLGYTGITVPANSTSFIGAQDSGGLQVFNAAFGLIADEAAAGFLGAPLVTRQSITGATTQDQVDSLVAALVAFGLVTDDR